MLARSLALALLVTLTGCDTSPGDCADDQVEVVYLGGDRDDEVVCKPRPASCPNPATCGDIDCIRDMYALCELPYSGVGCSDTFAPPIISCNP